MGDKNKQALEQIHDALKQVEKVTQYQIENGTPGEMIDARAIRGDLAFASVGALVEYLIEKEDQKKDGNERN